MLNQITEKSVQQNFSQIINEIALHHDNVVVTQKGRAVAAIVDMETFNRLTQMKNRFDMLLKKCAVNDTEKVLQANINEAIKAVRA